MICDEFSYPKGLCVYAKRNLSFVSELLTYEVVKEDAPDIGMLAQDKPVIFVHEISKVQLPWATKRFLWKNKNQKWTY